MFKSISFVFMALTALSAQAMTFDDEQETHPVFQTLILKSDKTVLKYDFKNEITVQPSDFHYGNRLMKVESIFERFNKFTISKQFLSE